MKIVTSVCAVLILSFAAFGQTDKPCEVKTKKDVSKRCQNKTVTMTGTISKTVMQHPVMTLPEGLGGAKKTFQNYIDTKFGQIVLISGEEITCGETVEVTGILKMKSLGGKAGTKESYKNSLIEVAAFSCK